MNATFSDDTTSGRWAGNLRGPRRVTFVSRAEDQNAFDWLQDLRVRVDEPEIKSVHVMPLLDADPRVREQVLEKVEAYSIFIVDLHGYRQQLLDPLIKRLGPLIPPGDDPYAFVLQLPKVGSHARLLFTAVAASLLIFLTSAVAGETLTSH